MAELRASLIFRTCAARVHRTLPGVFAVHERTFETKQRCETSTSGNRGSRSAAVQLCAYARVDARL